MMVVLKLGGSLLTHRELPDRLSEFVRQQPDKRCLMVIGGGTAADVVRKWSHLYRLSDEVSHWLAISSMDLNRELVQHLTGWRSVNSLAGAHNAWSQNHAPLLLNIRAFAENEEAIGNVVVSHSWNSTSDSIAAWVAHSASADELILLKSTLLPPDIKMTTAVQMGLIDADFPRLAAGIPVIRWCNLRESPVRVHTWIEKS